MNVWSARQYLKFEDDRTRPSRDLLAQVPLDRAERVSNLGCGPGNSTELLIERFPYAEVIGLDSSTDRLRQARERLPGRAFVHGDLATWSPQERTDLLFANAVFQWVPNHPETIRVKLLYLDYLVQTKPKSPPDGETPRLVRFPTGICPKTAPSLRQSWERRKFRETGEIQIAPTRSIQR